MRPDSILRFERIYLISLLLVLVQQLIGFFLARSMFGQFLGGADAPAELGASFGASFGAIMMGAMFFGLAMTLGVPLLFWWLAARKRQEFAKWLLLVISVLSTANWLFSLAVLLFMLPQDMMNVAGLGDFRTMQLVLVVVDAGAEALGIFALTYLFRQDAIDWFRSAHPGASADIFR